MNKILDGKAMKKILMLMLLVVSSYVGNVQAAPTDCIGMGGEVACTEPIVKWRSIYQQEAATFEELIQKTVENTCSNAPFADFCVNRDTSGSINGYPPCLSCYSTNVTKLSADKSSGWIYIAKGPYDTRDPDPRPRYVYNIQGGSADRLLSCPIENDIVYPNGSNDKEKALCKPRINRIPNDSGCPYGTCPTPESQGVSSGFDPVNFGSGNKYEVQTDYVYNSNYPLTFTRIYNSKPNLWTNEYSRTLTYLNSNEGEFLILGRPTGDNISYQKENGNWISKNKNTTYKLLNISNEKVEILNDVNEIETYINKSNSLNNGSYFQLSKITKPGGGVFQLFYNTTSLLSEVKDPYGRSLKINITPISGVCLGATPNILRDIEGPNGVKVVYTYDNSCRLIKVTNPDGTFKQIGYDSSNYGLSTIKDELGNLIQQNGYNYNSTLQQYTTAFNTKGADNVERGTFVYTNTTTTVTDARGNSVVMNKMKNNGFTKATGFNSYCSFCNGVQGSNIQYNTNGFISQVTDYKGNITQMSWDESRNLLTSVKEAVGTSIERETVTSWNSDWRLPAQTIEPVSGGNKTTTYTYNNEGKITEIKVEAPKNDGTIDYETRIWTFIYNNVGELIEVRNPNYINNNNEKTTITYDLGRISTITNGLGQVISFSNYHVYGMPQEMTLVDGTKLILEYNAMNNVTKITKSSNDNLNTYSINIVYNNAQLVEKVFSPSGNYKKYIYDPSQRLTQIEEYNNTDTYLGKIVFTLDKMSNITKTQLFDNNNSELRLSSAEYDNKNRLWKDINAFNNTSIVTYDANSNIEKIVDPKNNNTLFSYDALNRLVSQTNTDNGVVAIEYNIDDTIASITDPKGLATTFRNNGFGELIEKFSPDTNTNYFTRDIKGNVIQKIDGKNQLSTYTYDVLNRVTHISYLDDSSKDITLVYDCFVISQGKLCEATDETGTTTYDYDNLGRMISKTHNNGNFSTLTQYHYNNVNQIDKITYPSGLEINYSYENDKVSQLSYTKNGVTTSLITQANYQPFESRSSSYTLNNNVLYSRGFNKTGLIGSYSATIPNNNVGFSLGYDENSNINKFTNTNDSTVKNASYDVMNRLTTFNNHNYTYNTTGDRLTKTEGTTTENYSYPSDSHQLSSVDNNNFITDGNGSIISEGEKGYVYDVRGRMNSFNSSSTFALYKFNFQGQRLYKTINLVDFTWYNYDESGNLISELDENGNTKVEYIWFNGMPIATIKNNELYYIFNDHLNTPRTIINSNNDIIWQWNRDEAFGDNEPIATNFEFNLRYPGQYFDKESNLYYNYFRDYNPKIGRYMQSDPIGLTGGINTYSYVNNNPLGSTDIFGLSPQDIEEIKKLFDLSIEEMIAKNMRLPGSGNDKTNFNNQIAMACNPNIQNRGGFQLLEIFCSPKSKTIEYCDGQSTYLNNKLTSNLGNFDDNWKFISQNNGGHWWLIGLSSNKDDPILYLDVWDIDFSIGKECRKCKNGLNPIGERPLTKQQIKELLNKGN